MKDKKDFSSAVIRPAAAIPSLLPLMLLACCLAPACTDGRENHDVTDELRFYLQGKTLYLAGDWDAALALLRKIRPVPGGSGKAGESAGSPVSVPALFLKGKIHFMKDEFPEAETVWKILLARNPHHGETRKWLSRLLLARGRREEAENVALSALADDPEDPELLILVGKARLSGGDTAGAIEYFSKAESCFIRLAEAPLELAGIYRSYGLRDRSIRQLELAAALLGKESRLHHSVMSAAESLRKEAR